MSISPGLLTFSAQVGSNQITINSNTNWTLTAQQPGSWYLLKEQGVPKILPISSNGSHTYDVEVQANPLTNLREVNLLFTCNNNTQSINISQAGQINNPPQSPCWPTPVVTDKRHIVIIPFDVQIDINGSTSLNFGDWIGFFYKDGNTEYCAGQGEWKGVDLPITLFGDDNLSNGKNGFLENEKFIIKICRVGTTQPIDVTGIFFNSGNGRYTEEDLFKTNGFSGVIRLESIISCIQLPIRKGYNLVSSFVLPKISDMLHIFSLRTNDVYVLDQDGSQTLPYLKINNIGNWNILQGYEVRSKDDFKIDKVFCGTKVDPSQYQFDIESKKWRIMSYLRDSPKT
ncbi:MAG: BACON domain-containing protein [Saprospiraceae bacterium]|nr:BACON domain-containing protein [Saprospiraceae bacterium]